MTRPKFLIAVFCLLASSPLGSEIPGQPWPRLIPGEAIERALDGEEVHVYRLELKAGHLLRAVIEQQGIDLVVVLRAPGGGRLAEFDSPTGEDGPEPVHWVVESDGGFQLEVRGLDSAAKPGRYRLTLEPPRRATERDRRQIAAEQAMKRADALYLQAQTEADVHRAREIWEQALGLWRELGDRRRRSETLNVLGVVHFRLDDYPKALEYYHQALPMWQAEGDAVGEAMTTRNIGMVYESQGDLRKAIDLYDRLLELDRRREGRLAEALTLRRLADVHADLGDYPRSLEYFRQARPLIRELASELRYTNLLIAMGSALYRSGASREARHTLLEALALARKIGNSEIAALFNLGIISQGSGRYSEALDYYRQALNLAEWTGDREEIAETLHNIGTIHWRWSEWRPALDFLGRALELRRVLGSRLREAQTLSAIGRVHQALGDAEEATRIYQQSLSLLRIAGARDEQVEVLTHLGEIFASDDSRRALEFVNSALELSRQTGSRSRQAGIRLALSRIYSSTGSVRQAQSQLEEALTVSRALEQQGTAATVLLRLGSLYGARGDSDRALATLLLAARRLQELGDPLRHIEAQFEIARVERRQGRLAAAAERLDKVLEGVESLRAGAVHPAHRASFLASRQSYYESYVDLLMALAARQPAGDWAAGAWAAAERGRARGLLDALHQAEAGAWRHDVPGDLPAALNLASRQLNDRQRHRLSLLDQRASAERLAEVEAEISDLVQRHRELDAEARARSPRYAALTPPKPVDLGVLQRRVLDEETLLLEYALGTERSFLWAVTATSFEAFELPRRAEIETTARRFYGLVSNPAPWQAEAQATLAGRRMSELLLAPVSHLLADRRLVIVADGALHYVPFAALARPGSDRPLIAEREVVSLPSASSIHLQLRRLAGRLPAPGTVAVLADPVFQDDDSRVRGKSGTTDAGPELGDVPVLLRGDLARSAADLGIARFPRLPFTRQEADTILGLVPEDQRLAALDFDASRATVSGGELGRFRIVHFATHGLLNNRHPELSGLVLSLVDEQGLPRDGFLRAYEIYDLELSAELVVLSACRTALGLEISGEGLVGLTRGFLHAGAARVLVSLWDVHDQATAVLMERFYRSLLADDQSAATALRNAQKALSEHPRWQAPYYWSGFVLQGDWR